MGTYEEALKKIGPMHFDAMEKAQHRLDGLTKPLGSLGKLEGFVKQLAGITGNAMPCISRKCVVIMCSDNGVVSEGVSSCPKSVTSTVTQNFTRGITGINVLSSQAGSDIMIIDIGIDDDIRCEGVVDRKIRKGTWNMAQGPAMTRSEAVKAIETGIEAVRELKSKGYHLLGTGEMGVGNTTTSSAVSSVLLGMNVEAVVGRGAGLSTEGLNNKISVIKRAIEVNKPDASDPLDVLAKVGGFDVAGLTGCFIGAAESRLPIVIDGFISGVAALTAVKIEPQVQNFLFPSHGSAEPGSDSVLKAIGMEPILNLGMRLGEGTGAALAFQILDAAVAAYTKMGTFGDANIEQYVPLE